MSTRFTMKPGAILATNTSSIPLEDLRQNLTRPQHFVGIHFFNPVSRMQLVEVVSHDQVAADVLAEARAFLGRIDRLPAPVKSAPGFLVNRALTPYLMEAFVMLEDGAKKETIDRAAEDFGMPMGPIELADVVGLDVAAHVGEIIARELGRPAPQLPRLAALLAAKKLGRKSGEGFYVWQDGKAVKSAGGGPAPEDLEDRLILVLVNECVACLRERVVDDEDLADAAVIFGTGFAPFRGGPLSFARARGTGAVVARLGELAARHGPRFTPDAGWALLAQPRKT